MRGGSRGRGESIHAGKEKRKEGRKGREEREEREGREGKEDSQRERG